MFDLDGWSKWFDFSKDAIENTTNSKEIGVPDFFTGWLFALFFGLFLL